MQKAAELISSIKGQFVAIAVSGGMDSMCLLHMCLNILGRDNIMVLSVNHNLRGDESDGDYEFVRNYCDSAGCQFLGESIDVRKLSEERGIGTELAARHARRKFFLSVKGRARMVLLAHHQSDQAETVLLHILRGCGQDGLKGMEILSEDYYFRPLLGASKKDIENYVHAHNVPYRTDSTNAASDYDRNFLRNEVIPLILTRWGGAERSIARLATIMSTYRSEINEQFVAAETNGLRLNFAQSVQPAHRHNGSHNLERNSGQTEQISPNNLVCNSGQAEQISPHNLSSPSGQLIDYIRYCLGKLDLLVDISYDNLVAISRLTKSPSGKKFACKNFTVTREFDSLLFTRRNNIASNSSGCKGNSSTISSGGSSSDCSSTNTCCGGSMVLANIGIVEISREDYNPRRYAAIFDRDKLPPNCEIRYRLEGDIFTPFGGKTKKLKKYFIDKKVPQGVRDHLPLIALGNEVYVIMDMEISDKLRIDNNTTKLSILGRTD